MRARNPRDAASAEELPRPRELEEPLEILMDSVVMAANGAPRRKELADSLRDALGAVYAEPVWVDLRKMVDTVIDAASAGARATTRLFRNHSPGPIYAYVDYTHLSLALLHVVQNAINAANRINFGEVWIRVQPSTGGGAYIEISDNGVGMDRETLRQAFMPFFTTRPGEAAGLGLPVARAMVESFGGHIDIQSEPSMGTVAMVQLPGRPSLPH